MRAGAQARTIFAGLGVTSSLVGAIGAVFAITGGVLAFQGWPQTPDTQTAPLLQVPAAAATAQRTAPVLQLAAAPAAAPAGAAQPGLARTVSARRPVRRTARTSLPGPAPATQPAGSAPGVSVPQGQPAPTPTGLAGVAQGTTSTASGAVRAVGHAVPAAQPVTEPAANAIDALGRGLGGALKHLTAPR